MTRACPPADPGIDGERWERFIIGAMHDSKLRWGILSTAQIARKNWLAIRNSGNSVVTAVASRDRQRSQKFIQECQQEASFAQLPVAHGSYEELLADPKVDAVYIPLPTAQRKEWVLRAASAGKHVLCEKPCAISLPDLQEMTEACREHKVQFMDGVMFVHSDRLQRIRAVLDDGASIGEIRRMSCGFSFCAPPEFFLENIRAHSGMEPAGCLGDLGWYCLRFALWAMRWQTPRLVRGQIHSEARRPDSPGSVPTDFSGELLFNDGASAGFYVSFRAAHQQWAHVSGAKGCLTVPDFVLPYYGSETSFEVSNAAFEVAGCQFNMEPRLRRVIQQEYSNSHSTAQETQLFRHFGDQVQSGQLNRDWPDQAFRTQQAMEGCFRSAREGGHFLALS